MNIIRRIIYAIINFIKIIITFLIKLITSFFTPTKKEKQQQKIINIENPKQEGTNTNYTASTTALPDTNPLNTIETNTTEDTTSNKGPIVFSIKGQLKNDINIPQVKRQKWWKDEELDDMFNDILEEEYDIQVKYTKYTLKEKIEKLKIKLAPKIEEKILYYEADRKPKLHDVMKKVIMEELKEKPIKELEPFKKKPKIQDEIYIITTPVKEEIEVKEPQEIKVEPIVTVPEEKKDEIKKEIEEKPFIITPVVDEPPKINFKHEITNTVKATSLIAANVALDIAEEITKSDDVKEQEKEPTKEETKPTIKLPTIEAPTNEDLATEISLIKEDIKEEIKPVIIDIIPNQPIPDIEQVIEKEHQKEQQAKKDAPKVEKEEEKTTKEEPKKEENKKEEKKEDTITYVPIVNLTPIINEEKRIAEDIITESEKEEFEDKDYDSIEERINELLDQLEAFLIKNDKYLSTSQRNKIYREQDRLRSLRNSLHTSKEIDITNETIALEENITVEELSGLKKELQKQKMENNLDLQEHFLSKVEDLNNLTAEQANEIERKLIKQKLRKALRVAEIPFLLSLPFIKNKYFRYFTAGLFVHNHFNFLNGLLHRQTVDISLPDMNAIRQGRDALNAAIDMNYENIAYLDYLEREALAKHPGLQSDNEYLLYINNLRNRLNNNYNKLVNKQNSIERHLARINKNTKKLKKKRYYQNINNQ